MMELMSRRNSDGSVRTDCGMLCLCGVGIIGPHVRSAQRLCLQSASENDAFGEDDGDDETSK
jgi:hypothetical protein